MMPIAYCRCCCLALCLAACLLMPAGWSAAGTLSGRIVLQNGELLAGGLVVVYNGRTGPEPMPERYMRIPDIIGELDEQGGFRLELEPGDYYLGGLRRKDGQAGPPREGDIFFIYRGENRSARIIRLQADSKIDLGLIVGNGPYRQPVDAPDNPATIFTGIVSYSGGKPASGKTVVAILTRDSGSSAYIAPLTASNGRFILRVPGGGIYRLSVWETGAPGEDDEGGETIRIETGHEREINLRVQ